MLASRDSAYSVIQTASSVGTRAHSGRLGGIKPLYTGLRERGFRCEGLGSDSYHQALSTFAHPPYTLSERYACVPGQAGVATVL